MASVTGTDLEEKQQQTIPAAADRILITYYTDPLCCWSWALEPHWKKLKEEFRDSIEWKYVMGGMIQDWNTYHDPMNSVNKPLQFGPIWMHASQISGAPMDFRIWHEDPPASSFPACMAVKCAMLQSPAAGETMLYHLREAVMTKALNISRESVILSIAKDLSEADNPVLDFDRFSETWRDGGSMEAFRSDLQQTRFLKIGRYPTLTFTDTSARGIMITGYRPYAVLKDALTHMLNKARK